MEPIWQLLNTKQKDEQWNNGHKGALRSAMAGRQFTQLRVKQCGWSTHERCLFCLWRLVKRDADADLDDEALADKLAAATEEQLARAPVGDPVHRIWSCFELKESRDKEANEADRCIARTCELRRHPTWERGLTTKPARSLRLKSWCETFNWNVKPKNLPLVGTCYNDGSCREGTIQELARCGWAFTFVDSNGEIVGSAYGVPPPWITDIGGAEAWALLQALMVSIPVMSRYWTDCLPLFEAMGKGPSVANSANNLLARVHNLIFAALDDCDPMVVGWMPSHLEVADLAEEEAIKSDGTRITELDLKMNDDADTNAKRGVQHHRVPPEELERWNDELERAKERARWIGIATHQANNSPEFPYRDSEAARWKAKAAQRRKMEAREGLDGRRSRRGQRTELAPEQGGHNLVRAAVGKSWLCTICKVRSTERQRLSMRKCRGYCNKTAISTSKDDEHDRVHTLLKSGTLTWCGICGAFSESRVGRLKRTCMGPPPRQLGSGGVRAQLERLRAGKHPVTVLPLPLTTKVDGTPVKTGGYSRLSGRATVDDGFIPYVPGVLVTPIAVPTEARADRRRWLLHGRIRMKQAAEVRQGKKKRRAERHAEAVHLFESFVKGSDSETCQVCEPDDEHRMFWQMLGTKSTTDRLAGIPVDKPAFKQYTGKPSRLVRLAGTCNQG